LAKEVRIAFYISDHGFGHATRDIALIRALLASDLQVKVRIRTEGPFDLVTHAFKSLDESIDSRIEMMRKQNDFGFLLEERGWRIDKHRTALMYENWVQTWDSFVTEETVELQRWNPDVIVSDIAPQPFLVAEELEIPSLGFSNFNWIDNYEAMLEDEDVDLGPLFDAYNSANAVIALPFTLKLAGFRQVVPVGLICRKPTLQRGTVRSNLSIGDSLFGVVYLGMQTPTTLGFRIDIDDGVKWWGSTGALPGLSPPDVITSLDIDPLEAQNLISAADLYLGKPGYSSVAEAVSSRVPMFLISTPGFPEGDLIAREVISAGIGKVLTQNELAQKDLDSRDALCEAYSRLPPRLSGDGIRDAVGHILKACS